MTLASAFLATQLAGCATFDEPEPVRPVVQSPEIPAVPSDVLACFQRPTIPPDAETNAGDVEKLWKTDRAALVKVNGCLHRLVCQYQDVRRDIGHVDGVACEEKKPAPKRKPSWLSMLRGGQK